MQRRLSMVVEGMRIKKEEMRIDVPYVTQELMNGYCACGGNLGVS
jgi:hypothetical protein